MGRAAEEKQTNTAALNATESAALPSATCRIAQGRSPDSPAMDRNDHIRLSPSQARAQWRDERLVWLTVAGAVPGLHRLPEHLGQVNYRG